MMKNKNIKSGDTLMEVMVSISIFAMLMIGGLTLMNSGLSKSQATLQLTMARNAMDAQAESLRFMNDAYIAQYPNATDAAAARWQSITSNAAKSASSLSAGCLDEKTMNANNNIFIIDPVQMTKISNKMRANPVYPRLVYSNTVNDTNAIAGVANFNSAEGLWIEAVKGSSNYYDFHIRACWVSPGSSVPTTLGTIVRLYDPKK